MRILSRYVLREYLVPLFYCMTGFVSIYVLFELFGSFSRIADAHLPFGVVVAYFCAYLAPYFEWLAPAALMLAALYTMWNFCRHSEIVAMRANGIGFLSISAPILAVACLMAAFVWWVNDDYVPRRAQWARVMRNAKFSAGKIESAGDILYCNADDNRTWSVGSLGDPSARTLRDVRVTVDRPDGGARLMNVTAPSAEFLDGEWWFHDAQVRHYDADGVEAKSPAPELDALRFRCFPEFRERPEDFLMQNREWAYNSVADRFHYLRTNSDMTAETRRKCVYDTWAKILAPLACIVITLFAIPAGIASGRQSVFRGVIGALLMFFSYYGLVIGCMVGASCGWLPPVLAAFLPPTLFLFLGVRAFIKQR